MVEFDCRSDNVLKNEKKREQGLTGRTNWDMAFFRCRQQELF